MKFLQRLTFILLYSGTRFYELVDGLMLISFGFSIIRATDAATAVSVFSLLPQIWWIGWAVVSGLIALYGSTSQSIYPRIVGASMSMVFWLFWAVVSYKTGGLIYSVLFYLGFKDAFVIFRVFIDRNRPLKGDFL